MGEHRKDQSSCCSHDHKGGALINHNAVKEEFFCHFPYAVFSVALALVLVSFVCYNDSPEQTRFAYRLFHNFHFLHLLFAASGTVLMFRRYSSSFWGGILVFYTGYFLYDIRRLFAIHRRTLDGAGYAFSLVFYKAYRYCSAIPDWWHD